MRIAFDTLSQKYGAVVVATGSVSLPHATFEAGASASASSRASAMLSADTSHVATWHPAAASCRTSSRPMPVPPPVTTAMRPSNRSMPRPMRLLSPIWRQRSPSAVASGRRA